MYNQLLKGMYYIPNNENENPYEILKNANKNKLNFVIIEYSNISIFDKFKINESEVPKLLYIQDKILSFEKKYKNTIGIICFKCRSLIGTFRILLSKSIFKGEIFKLKNFYLWCYLNNPTLILSHNNYSHIENDNMKKYFKLYTDNFSKSTNNYIKLLNTNLNLSPIYTKHSFIFIKNTQEYILDYNNLKNHIEKEIKNGNFYISNFDKLNLNFTINSTNINSIIRSKNNLKELKINIDIESSENYDKKIVVLSDKNDIIKEQNCYNLRRFSYVSEIKNNANKFFILKITSKQNSFALTPPIYTS